MPEPDSTTIDAWLAGDLPADAAAAIERHLDRVASTTPTEAEEEVASDLLRDLPKIARDPEVSSLVDLIKTRHDASVPAPTRDTWREVLTPSDDPDLLGTIGDYQVLGQIATGGMGIVLKARDPELDRVAAIKVLSPELASNATARARFLREARAAAGLEHENILPIYGVHDEAVPYFAMRYAAGGTLQDALEDGVVPFETQRAVARGVAAALAAAHAKGIVHRDIKPANILFDTAARDKVWVCDFGIARSTEDPSLTYAGAVAGTPQYMSPEQAEGAELDGRSDLFSLGAVLYRCATGGHVSRGNTTAAVLRGLRDGLDTKIRLSKAGLPPSCARLLTNLLARDPCDRPRDATEVVRAIDDEHSARPRRTAGRRRRLVVATVSLVALAAGSLMVPAVRTLVSRALAMRHEQGFVVEGRLGAQGSLADAITTARDGETIEGVSKSWVAYVC